MPSRIPLTLLLLLLPCLLRAQVPGCTDPLATNYSAAATKNDGSCTYPPVTLTAATVVQLSDTVQETSGLLFWNSSFWTHNDDGDTSLYALDTADGHILRRVRIAGAPNRDWEELAQDDDYLYIGDFGNNVDGNRQDLTVLRVSKSAILTGQNPVTPDKISFRYADQTSFTPTGNNNSDFDCEAFIATTDSLYLFTKQWVSGKSKLYALPKTPGSYSARPVAEYNVDGLVAGATYLPAKKLVALCGYKIAGLSFQPFIVLLYDYSGHDFFSGNKRKLLVNPAYHQTEAIAGIDGRKFFLTNEKLSQSIITITPKLQQIDLTAYLANWYGSLGAAGAVRGPDSVSFYPNPAGERFSATVGSAGGGPLEAVLFDETGRKLRTQHFSLQAGANRISFEREAGRPAGTYFMRLFWEGRTAWGRINLY